MPRKRDFWIAVLAVLFFALIVCFSRPAPPLADEDSIEKRIQAERRLWTTTGETTGSNARK